MAAFSIKNLVSTEVTPCEPWLFKAKPPTEVTGKENKAARDAWINDPNTEHQVYSLIEGLNPFLRVSKDAKDHEGNPPFKLHGLVGDYDAPVSDEELQTGVGRLNGKLPAYMERTLSGNSRFIWLFETPVAVPSRDFLVSLLKMARKAVKADLLSVGFDVPAWDEPGRYYTNSGVWQEVSNYRIPTALVQGWVFEVAKKHKWQREGSIEVPLPVAWAELQKKYPLHGWPGEFELESQGPTFWIPESASPKSAIVKATGIYTFSSSASRPFWSWSDLLGSDFVEEYKVKNIGKAVEGIYHDGQKYWRKNGQGSWRSFTKEDLASHLFITRRLKAKSNSTETPSEIDEAMEYIREWQSIDGAAPCAFQNYGVYTGAGPRILNTHTRRVLTPSEDPEEWGPNGRFPWLSRYFDYLFDPIDQKDYFLAWLRRLYKGAYELNMLRGQNVFLIGSPGTGKTLLSQNILTKLMSGSADAQAYLLNDSNFNSQLFEVALWLVDDNSSTVSAQKHAMFSSSVKKLASNQLFEYNKKFGIPAMVEWLGRVFVTANDDEESLRIIPDLEISALEKTMLFRTTKVPYNFPPDAEVEVILRRELCHFARWLLDWTPPEHTQGTNRYGVARYHEATLLRKAEHASRSNSFSEILDDWKLEWFKDHPTETVWKGTAFALLMSMNGDEKRRAVLRDLKLDQVTRQLAALKAKGGHKIESFEENKQHIWKISK
jgi:hypothetical protein